MATYQGYEDGTPGYYDENGHLLSAGKALKQLTDALLSALEIEYPEYLSEPVMAVILREIKTLKARANKMELN
jgi:hypothetical protein